MSTNYLSSFPTDGTKTLNMLFGRREVNDLSNNNYGAAACNCSGNLLTQPLKAHALKQEFSYFLQPGIEFSVKKKKILQTSFGLRQMTQ